jgi:hypothetical protein
MTRLTIWRYIVIVSAVIVVCLVVAWFVGLKDWGDLFSLGQFLVDVLLLPVAIFGFVLAMEEFRKAQASPSLDLYWETEASKHEKEIVLEVPRPVKDMPLRQIVMKRDAHLVLVNEGQAVAIWYSLRLNVPLEIAESATHFCELEWRIDVSEQDCWQPDRSSDELRVVFLSNGRIAAYPDYPLSLGTLVVPVSAAQEPKEYRIPYTIVSDRARPRRGFLAIRFFIEAL